jgi:hypothetical protein
LSWSCGRCRDRMRPSGGIYGCSAWPLGTSRSSWNTLICWAIAVQQKHVMWLSESRDGLQEIDKYVEVRLVFRWWCSLLQCRLIWFVGTGISEEYTAFVFSVESAQNLYYKPEMSRVRFPMRSLDFSIYLIFPAALWPWGRLSLLQKGVPGIILGVKGGRRVRLTTLPPSVTRLWKPRRPTTLWATTACYRDSFTSFARGGVATETSAISIWPPRKP